MFYSKVTAEHQAAAEIITLSTDAAAIEQLLAKGFIPAGTQPTTSEPITAYWRHLAHIICLYASK